MTAPGRMQGNRARSQAALALLCGAGLAWLYFGILRATGGHFVYSLDDPYIHLALAENLLQGHYGINFGEVSSPSSSILYPILLAGTLVLGLGDLGPLVLNLAGMLGVAWILGGLLHDLLDGRLGQVLVLGAALLLAVNGYGLVFTGMEHSLHMLAALVIVTGLAGIARGAAPGWPMLAAIVIAPLLRFEGLALSGAALIALVATGHWRGALAAGAGIVATIGAFVGLMLRLGLPVLPSSVMVKSGASAAVASDGGGFREEILVNLAVAIYTPPAVLLAVAIGLLLLAAARGRTTALLVLPVAAAALAHILVGEFGWFSRYEVYILAACLAALLIAWRDPLKSLHAQPMVLALVALFCVVGAPYLVTTVKTPGAAMNIETQQYQMHRFATEFFPGPVAVNDLGWVSWRNDAYVLDLWGLGSEEARRLSTTGTRSPETIAALVAGRDVPYAMLYEEWFPDQLPPDWCRIAQLSTPEISAGSGTVEFFLIDGSREAELRAALESFAEVLPPQDSLAQFDCDSTAG